MGKAKGKPTTPKQQTATERRTSLQKLAENIAAMDEELADLERAIIIERVRTGAILPSWAEKLLKPASKPPSAEPPKPASEPEAEAEPKSKPVKEKRKFYWDEPVIRALRETYGNNATNHEAGDVVDKVLEVLDSKIKESGRKPPSRGLILRHSGHWKKPD
jgi:hypothetical protein